MLISSTCQENVSMFCHFIDTSMSYDDRKDISLDRREHWSGIRKLSKHSMSGLTETLLQYLIRRSGDGGMLVVALSLR